MPRYDYRCSMCEHVFEIERPMGSRDDVYCPACDAAAKKVFSPTGMVLKGTGFHNTDYRPRETSDGSTSGTAACPSASGGCAGCPASTDA